MKVKQNRLEKEKLVGPAVAVDVLIFTIRENNLNVLLIEIGGGPYKDKWALPGGMVEMDESLDEAAGRVLNEKAGLEGIFLEQLYTFGAVERDKRGRVISVAYYALVESDKFDLKTMDYYSDIAWKPIDALPEIAFDHKQIMDKGIERLRKKLQYSNIAYAFLPKEFTLTELQNVYEVILGHQVDKRNFRKKMKTFDIIKPTGKKEKGVKYRPAELYAFKKRRVELVK